MNLLKSRAELGRVQVRLLKGSSEFTESGAKLGR